MELKCIARREGRLSSFLLGELKMSAGLMNKLKWDSFIRVNGIPQRTNYPVRPGDVITVFLQEEPADYPAEDGAIHILYEDDHLLAVDKPAGMLIHPSRARNTGTLANFVLGYYRQQGLQSAFHPLTRLDRDTFGIVLLAKNSHVHTLLQQADVRKTYHAITFGGPEAQTGIIDAPIDRKPLPSLLRFVGEGGKPSVTSWRILGQQDGLYKLALKPVTGRTHQLRVHCAHMGFPILGDPQYGSEASIALSRQLGLSSQLLCAKKLEFTHPMTGEAVCLFSDMDANLGGLPHAL